jgi:hypothetical protein
LETTIMTRVTAKGLIAIAAAASIALLGAVSTADAGKKGGKGGGGGGGGFKVSSHVNKGAKFNSGPKFNYSKKARSGFETVRYGEGKYNPSKHGKQNYAKKWNNDHYRYGKNVHYRRYNYAWAGLPLYTSYAGCGWIYRKAVSTGSDYWWDRYYRCAQYSRY